MNTPIILKIFHNGKNKEYFVIPESELHTDLGIIKFDKFKEYNSGDKISSHLGFEFIIQKPKAPDFFSHAKRSGAPMMPKDIGIIISETGACSSDSVLDAGTGSGILAIYLGGIVKRLVSYEINPEFFEIAKKNVAFTGLSNIELRNGDIVEELHKIDEKFDIITLDTQSASEVISYIPQVLNYGGFLVTYSPFFEQTKEIRQEIEKTNYRQVKTIEIIEREISFTERGTRPATTRVGHTGFITVVRY